MVVETQRSTGFPNCESSATNSERIDGLGPPLVQRGRWRGFLQASYTQQTDALPERGPNRACGALTYPVADFCASDGIIGSSPETSAAESTRTLVARTPASAG